MLPRRSASGRISTGSFNGSRRWGWSLSPPRESAVELRPADIRRARNLRELAGLAVAFAGLVAVDLLVKRRGFPGLYRRISSAAVQARKQDPSRIGEICSAVDRAAALYFKRAWCLQRSATATFLLRRAGFPAEMVIGVQRMPFAAHAWVELGGEVANDRPGVREAYQVIERFGPSSGEAGR